MSDDPTASTTVTFVLPQKDDFDAILAAVMGTSQGRWFLQEFARRQRSADVQAMLAAIERIGAAIAQDRIAFADQGARAELCAIATFIAETRTDLPDAMPPAQVLDDLNHRIGAWLARTAADAGFEHPGETPAQLAAQAISDAPPSHLAHENGIAPSHTHAPSDGERPAPPTSGQTMPSRIPSMWEPVAVSASLQRTRNGSDADERDY